jgi:hypothetical protein
MKLIWKMVILFFVWLLITPTVIFVGVAYYGDSQVSPYLVYPLLAVGIAILIGLPVAGALELARWAKRKRSGARQR